MICAESAWERVRMAAMARSFVDDRSYCSVLALTAISDISHNEVNRRLGRKHGRPVVGWKVIETAESLGYTAVLVPKIDRGMDWNVVKNARKVGYDLTKGMHLVFSTAHVGALVQGELVDPYAERKGSRVWGVYTLVPEVS